jgi:dynein heavy chain
MEPMLIEENSKAQVEKDKIERESKIAGESEKIVGEETKTVEAQKDIISEKTAKVESQLAEATPILKEAEAAVDVITKNDITVLKSMIEPPKTVEKVMICVTIFLDQPKKKWEDIKKFLTKM